MQNDHREFELKFELAEDELRRIRSKRLSSEIAVGEPVTRDLLSTYFDTADCALRNAGLSLRIRRNHEIWLQTVKEDPGCRIGAFDRLESEHRVQGQTPDLGTIEPKRLRKRIERVLGDKLLEPVFETAARRTTQCLRASDGSEVELALDEVEIRLRDRLEKFHEAELELKSGSRQSLFALTKNIFADEPLRLTHLSKADRGYRLMDGAPSAPWTARSAEAPTLTPSLTAGQAFKVILRSTSDQVLHNLRVVLETDHPEGPHQLRVGLRRLRCALRAFIPLGDQATLRHLGAEARDLARLVGELRDADVMTDEFVAPNALREPTQPGMNSLLTVLRSHREFVREKVRRHLASARVKTFQLDLLALVEGDLPSRPNTFWNAPVRDHARATLERYRRKPSKLGKRLDLLSIPERHEMRKALKNLRYVAEFHASLFPRKTVSEYLRHLKGLQDVFGYLNDVEMTKKLHKICDARGSREPDMYWAIGYIEGSNEARAVLAWENARSRWRELKKAGTFWS